MDLIEEFPCANRSQAEARENYHIQRADNCVNKSIRQGAKLEPCAPKTQTAQTARFVVTQDVESAMVLQAELDAKASIAQKRADIEALLIQDAERADEVIRSHLMENEMKRLEIEMRLRAEAEHDDEQLRQKRLRDDDRWNECSFQRLARKPRGMMVSMEKLRALRDI